MTQNKKIKVPLKDIDEEVRGTVIALNKLYFVVTTQSCSGHSYLVEHLQGGRHTDGYIFGQRYRGFKGVYDKFLDKLKEFIQDYNQKNPVQFDLSIHGFLSSNKPFTLYFFPALKDEMWSSNLDGCITSYYDSNNSKDLEGIPRKRKDAWAKLEKFVREYK